MSPHLEWLHGVLQADLLCGFSSGVLIVMQYATNQPAEVVDLQSEVPFTYNTDIPAHFGLRTFFRQKYCGQELRHRTVSFVTRWYM